MSYRITLLEEGLDEWVEILQKSFETETAALMITEEQVPTNGAFIKVEALHRMKDQGSTLFGLWQGTVPVGFVVVEKESEKCYRFEKLAVLPEFRHKGYGGALVEYASEYIKKQGGKQVTIGLIDEHLVLKEWYQTLGFRMTKHKKFKHLPFTVCFMKKSL